MARQATMIKPSQVESKIVVLRGMRVILDAEIAILYGVQTRSLIQAVKRNRKRFPEDFMFQLTASEFTGLRSQTVISKGRGGRRYAPYAFTEQGVAMLSSVLSVEKAIRVNIEIMRVFVRLRQLASAEDRLARKIAELEEKYDGQFSVVFEAINQLMEEPEDPPRPPIGFLTELGLPPGTKSEGKRKDR